MNSATAELLEQAVRGARVKILESSAELERLGKGYDRPRIRLQVAAWQLQKIAAELRKVRKAKAGPERRRELHNRIGYELEAVQNEVRAVEDELTPWPVRVGRRFMERIKRWSNRARSKE